MEGGRSRVDLKVVVLGHGGVGKTSLINRYINDKFSETLSTIGASFVLKKWKSFYFGIWVNLTTTVIISRIRQGRTNIRRFLLIIAAGHKLPL